MLSLLFNQPKVVKYSKTQLLQIIRRKYAYFKSDIQSYQMLAISIPFFFWEEIHKAQQSKYLSLQVMFLLQMSVYLCSIKIQCFKAISYLLHMKLVISLMSPYLPSGLTQEGLLNIPCTFPLLWSLSQLELPEEFRVKCQVLFQQPFFHNA